MENERGESGSNRLSHPLAGGSDGSNERRVTLEHLRAFVEVCEAQGFYQASHVLHIGQSTVTRRIQQLEMHLGSELLKRTKGEFVGLTPAGSRFLSVARNVLRQLGQAIYTVKHPELCGLVRIGVPEDFLVESMPACIEQYRAEMPGTQVSVMSALSSPLLRAFNEKNLDIVIARVLETAIELAFAAKQEDWGAEPLCWVANRVIDFNVCNDLPLVLYPDGCVYRQAALTALARYGKPFVITYSSSSNDNMRRAVDTGLGIGVMRSTAVGPDRVILTEEHGFPPLPNVHLMLGLRDSSEPYQRAAHILFEAWHATRMTVRRPVSE